MAQAVGADTGGPSSSGGSDPSGSGSAQVASEIPFHVSFLFWLAS